MLSDTTLLGALWSVTKRVSPPVYWGYITFTSGQGLPCCDAVPTASVAVPSALSVFNCDDPFLRPATARHHQRQCGLPTICR
jgi:hypothetical protein